MRPASIPDTGGPVHSCNNTGAWRVIDTHAGQACKSNEAAQPRSVGNDQPRARRIVSR